jgi:hypothetical protein
MPAGASVYRYVALLAMVAAYGCNLDNPGNDPPRGLLYFPNAVALTQHASDEAPRYLLIANSNFDLRYKHGTVQAMSLARLAAGIKRCKDEATCTLEPAALIEDEVFINPFSTALAVSPDGRVLFAPTRTDSSLEYIGLNADADGDRVLSCGQSDRDCDRRAERGIDELGTGEKIDWPPDPVAAISGRLRDIAAIDPNVLGDDAADNSDIEGNYVIVAHRGGSASLFVPPETGGGFWLRGVLGGLPAQITELAFDPVSKLVHFTVLNGGNSKLIARAGVIVPRDADGKPDVDHSSLYAQTSLSLEAVAGFGDTRDLAFLPALPAAGAAFEGPRALVVSRSPSAVLVVDVQQSSSDSAASGDQQLPGRGRVERTVVVGAGASRITTGVIGGREIAVVSCFDSRELFVIDLATMLTRGVVPNLSGPFEVVIDEARQLVYLADFRSSVIRVIDVSPVSADVSVKPVRVVATVGVPRVLQELK